MVRSNLRRLVAACPVLLLAFFNPSGSMRAQAASFVGAQTTVPATGLKSPNGVAADLAGDVFIADPGNNIVLEIPVGGAQQHGVGSGLNAPQGVAVDLAGDVFIADTGNKRVVEIPSGGSQTTLVSSLNDPVGVAVDTKGNVWVADFGDGLVELPSGGGNPTVPNGFEQYITSVAVDGSGNLFVSNTYEYVVLLGYYPIPTIQEVPSGCTSWDCLVSITSESTYTGVAVDAADHIYVADGGTSIAEYSGTTLVETFGSGIGAAAGVAVDPRGSIVISDSKNVDVIEAQHGTVNFGNVSLGATGETLTLQFDVSTSGTLGTQNVFTLGASNSDFTLAGGSTCTGPVTQGDSCVVKVTFTPGAAGLRRGAVQLTDPEGNVATTMVFGTALGPEIAFGPGVQTTISSSLGLDGPDGVAVDGKGDIIIADTFNNRVINLPPKGAFTTLGSDLCEPAGVAVDGAGNVYIADYCNNRVVEVPTGGAAQVEIGSGFSGPKDVAVDGQGDVFVADTLNNRVVEVVAGGSQMVLSVSVGGLGLNSPTGVAVNAEGDVLIADTGNNRVVEVETNGVQTTIGTGFNQPTGVAVDGAGSLSNTQPGDVYVADYGNKRVVEVPVGLPQFTIGTGYVGPHGVAVDAAGDLLVADRDGSSAYEFQLSTPQALAFPTSTPVNQKDGNDGAMEVTVQNIGNLNAGVAGGDQLTIASVSYPANFLAHPPATGPQCNNGLQVKPGQSCSVAAEFDPTSVGANSGSIVLTDNALNANSATQSISASGTGLYDTQTITFAPALTSYPYTAGTFALSATASSNLTVSFASTTASICTVSGTTATIVTTGSCIVQATQAGNAIYSAATAVSVTFTIKPGPQTIIFNPAVTTYSFAAHSFPVSATSTSGLTVSFASTTPPVCKVSGATATILAGGICTIQATQPGNVDYSAATPVPVSFTITPVGQTLHFTAIKLPEYAASTLSLSATASSHLPVSFASRTPKVCTISGASAKLLIEGLCTIVASQPGNSSYTAASAKQSFDVSLASQKVDFPAITAKEYADTTLKLSATASSKLPVKFASETPSVCTVSDGKASLLVAGTCTIKATQPGNDVYAPAKGVTQSFTVLKKK